MALGNVSIAAVKYAYRRALAVIRSQITGDESFSYKSCSYENQANVFRGNSVVGIQYVVSPEQFDFQA